VRTTHLLLLSLAVALLPGCVFGLVYHHTIEPLDLDHGDTPVFTHRMESGTADLKVVTYAYLGVAWDGFDLASAAKENGIAEIYYADLETLRVMFVWHRYWVHIYGRPVTDPVASSPIPAQLSSATLD